MSVELSLDSSSLDHFNKQMDILRADGKRSLYSALIKVGMKIKTEAQTRLKGRRHIDTSRLVNSLYLKANPAYNAKGNADTYSNEPEGAKTESGRMQKKQSWSSDLSSVSVEKTEVAIGTNVEYGGKIENMDSFLYWAIQNVNVEQSVAKDMRDEMKFGAGVKKQQ